MQSFESSDKPFKVTVINYLRKQMTIETIAAKNLNL